MPTWWPLPLLIIAGIITAVAIQFLPGRGGHIPAKGLNAGTTLPSALPGVILAALAGIGLGAVVGPEAPLIALGRGRHLHRATARARRPAAGEHGAGRVGDVRRRVRSFGSPMIGAVLMLEASGIGGAYGDARADPGLLAAGLGSLISVGIGSWTGLSMSQIAIAPLQPRTFRARPRSTSWTIALAAAIAVVTTGIFHLGRRTERISTPRPLVVVPIVGGLVALLAIAFQESTDKGFSEVLFPARTSSADSSPGRGTLVPGGAGARRRLQGDRLRAVDRQLPRRPHVPR